MLDSRKVDVLIQWLGCFDVKIAKLSELGDGLKLLKLLSSIDPKCAAENVAPAEAFVQIEQILIGLHGSLPPGFLAPATKSGCRDSVLALAAALTLSSVVLHATRCGATEDMRPLLALDEASQSCIKDVVQTVSAGDAVLRNLRSYLRAKPADTGPSAVISPPSRLSNSASYVFSPTSAESPPKPSPIKTPERPPLKRAQLWEMQVLREQILDEEQTSANLQAEVFRLKKALRARDKEIGRLRETLATLEACSSEDASCQEQLRERIELMESQNALLQEQLLSMRRMQADYDDLIRQNAQLQGEKHQLSEREAELQVLEERLAAALSHGVELQAQLAASEEARASLASAMADQAEELQSLREFCASRRESRPPFLDSPRSPCTPTEHRSTSCFQELRLVELEEDSARLRSELEEKTAQHELESSALRATIAQLEEAKAQLEAELSQPTRDSAQQNLRTAGLRNDLLGCKSLAAELEPGLAVREDHLDVRNAQAKVVSNSSSAAGDAVEPLDSNVDIDVASRLSEAAPATEEHSFCHAALESGSHHGASPEHSCTVVCADEEENDPGAVITDVAEGFDSFSSDILAEGVDLPQPELGEGSSSSTLYKQLSCVEGEEEAHSPLPLEMQDKPEPTKVPTGHSQVLVRDLEGLCLQLQAALTDAEHRLWPVGEENAALVKIKEEVQRANTVLRSKLDEAVQAHTAISASLREQEDAIARLEEEKKCAIEEAEKLAIKVESLECEHSELPEGNSGLEQQSSRGSQSSEELHENLGSEDERTWSVAKACSKLQICVEGDALGKCEQEKEHLKVSVECVTGVKNDAIELGSSEKTCNAAKAVSAKIELSHLEEGGQVLKHADDSHDCLGKACEDELPVKCRLTDLQLIDTLKHEVSILREALVRMDLEKQFLHSSLMTAENSVRSLREACQAGNGDAKLKMEEGRTENEQPTHLVSVSSDTKRELSDTNKGQSDSKQDLSDMTQKASDTREEVSDASEGLSDLKELVHTCDGSANYAGHAVELKDETSLLLQEENEALKLRVSDLEAKLTDQRELQKCLEEFRARNDALQKQVELLASEAAQGKVYELENGRLRELVDEVDDRREAAACRVGELEEARRRLELDSEEREKRLAEAEARCVNVGRTCKILENKNAGLKMELEALRTTARKNLQEATSSATAVQARHKEELDALKEELDKEQALRRRRESLLTQHSKEMAQKLECLNKDSAALKKQLASKTTELAAVAQDRTRLAMENRSLKAQLSYCEAKMRDSELERGSRSSRSRAGALSASLYSTPSLDSLWSQRPSDSNTRQNSLASMASDHFPERREAPEDAEEVFNFSLGASSLPEKEGEQDDTLQRFSELHRRNSMVPLHLKSCYPAEAMPDNRLLLSSPPESFSASSSSSLGDKGGQCGAKKGASSATGREEGSGDKHWRISTMVTPKKSKPKKKATTPSSVKKLLRRTFKK
ncbi:uncharacterized protein LOC144138993 [Haemaphysalis longicornis]